MLASDGRMMLTDFGIASHPSDTRLTTEGAVVGSVEYLAPERLRGDPGTSAGE
jgi:serine/threonine protein kinase